MWTKMSDLLVWSSSSVDIHTKAVRKVSRMVDCNVFKLKTRSYAIDFQRITKRPAASASGDTMSMY